MKRTLLLMPALVALGASGAEPRVYPSTILVGMTPDNTVAISDYAGTVMFFDLESGEEPKIFSESADGLTRYITGNGNFAANGMIAASRGTKLGASVYIYGNRGVVNGRWLTVPGGATGTDMGSVNAVTADCFRLVGNAATGVEFGVDVEGTMTVPCYWEFDGRTIGKMQRLPYPELDYSGFRPQYVTAVSVSNDGRTIVGQQRCSSGRINEIVIYEQSADNSWSYFMPFHDMINPNHIEVPPYPGEGPAVPSQETYMTQEQLDAFNEAFAAYQANGGTPPTYEQFMDPDSIPRYNAEVDVYNTWVTAYLAWQDADMKIVNESTSFTFNQIALSPNGRYLGITSEVSRIDTTDPLNPQIIKTCTPWLYDIKERKIISRQGENITLTSVSDEGDVLGYNRLGDIDFGFFLPAGTTEWIPLHEYIASQHPDLAEWLDSNWTHDVEVEEIDENGESDYTFRTMTFGGLPIASPDFSYVMSSLYVFWQGADPSLAGDYAAYLLPLKKTEEGSIRDISADDDAGTPARIYDLQGRRVVRPAHGLYISNGKKTIR